MDVRSSQRLSPATHRPPAAGGPLLFVFPPEKWLQPQHIPDPPPSLSL